MEELPRPSDLKDDLSARDKKLSDVTQPSRAGEGGACHAVCIVQEVGGII